MGRHVWRRLAPDTVILFDDETLALIEVDDLTAKMLMQGSPEVADRVTVTDEIRESQEAFEGLVQSGIILLEHETPPEIQPVMSFLLMNISSQCDGLSVLLR
ncbi:MAG: hypothetical protein RDU89_07895 [bacterium]|nr:hypothetical protein [bacterium]